MNCVALRCVYSFLSFFSKKEHLLQERHHNMVKILNILGTFCFVSAIIMLLISQPVNINYVVGLGFIALLLRK